MNWDALGAIAELLGAIARIFDLGVFDSSSKTKLEGIGATESIFCGANHAS